MNQLLSKNETYQGVWSAMSTPLTLESKVDVDALAKLIEHQLKLGIKGLFIAGTAGEGPWLSDAERLILAQNTVRLVAGRMPVAMQITDNSAARMIENIKRYQSTGVDVFVLAPPFFQTGATQEFLVDMFLEVIDASPIPVGIYNRGKYSSVVIEPASLAKIVEHPKVIMLKDSACLPEYTEVILAARKKFAGRLHILNGNEFDCTGAIRDGYDGLLLGGGCFNGAMAADIIKLVRDGKMSEAQALQERMNNLMFKVFGGKEIKCWLAGQKELMKRLGVFNTAVTLLAYKLNDSCSAAINEVLKEEKNYLVR